MSNYIEKRRIGSTYLFPEMEAASLIAPLDFFDNINFYSDVDIIKEFNKSLEIDKKYAIKIINTDNDFEFQLPSLKDNYEVERITKCIIHRTYNGYDHIDGIDYSETDVRSFIFEAGSTKRYIIVCGDDYVTFANANYNGIEWMFAGYCKSTGAANGSGVHNNDLRFVHYNKSNLSFDGLGYCSYYGNTGLEGEVFVPMNVKVFSNITITGATKLTGVRYYGMTRREYIEQVTFTNNSQSNPLRLAGSLYLDDVEFTKFPNIEGVTKLQGNFNGCKSLRGKVELPSTLVSIGNYTFHNCINIDEIIIPPSVTSIGDCGLANLSRCKNIVIPSSVISLGNGALRGLSGCRYLVIPSSVTSIGEDCYIFDTKNANTRVIINAQISIIPRQWYVGSYYTDYSENVTEFKNHQYGGKYIVLRSEVPPVCGGMTSPYTYPTNIFVPINSLEKYKVTEGWINHASKFIGFTKVATNDDLPDAPNNDTWWYQMDSNILWHYINDNFVNFTDTSTP